MESTSRVRATLRRYADRGVFRGFGAVSPAAERIEYRFTWHAPWPHVLVVDARRRTVTLRDVLPEVPYRSPMDDALRAFVAGRSSPDLPAHRRIDPARALVRCRSSAGRVSIVLVASPGELAYAAEKAIKLLNEIFCSFLAGPWEEYMVRVFGVPEE